MRAIVSWAAAGAVGVVYGAADAVSAWSDITFTSDKDFAETNADATCRRSSASTGSGSSSGNTGNLNSSGNGG
jgi:hypothetical protein